MTIEGMKGQWPKFDSTSVQCASVPAPPPPPASTAGRLWLVSGSTSSSSCRWLPICRRLRRDSMSPPPTAISSSSWSDHPPHSSRPPPAHPPLSRSRLPYTTPNPRVRLPIFCSCLSWTSPRETRPGCLCLTTSLSPRSPGGQHPGRWRTSIETGIGRPRRSATAVTTARNLSSSRRARRIRRRRRTGRTKKKTRTRLPSKHCIRRGGGWHSRDRGCWGAHGGRWGRFRYGGASMGASGTSTLPLRPRTPSPCLC